MRHAARDKLIWASVTSEPGMRNDMTDAKTVATKVDGGPRLLLCRISLTAPGVTIQQTWDTMGMRATQSNDITYDGVFVADDDVVHSLPVGHLDARVFETVWSWAMGAFAAVYTGIAAGALEWTVKRLAARGRGADPLVQDTIGECEILVESARALAYRHAEEVGSRRLFELDVQEGIARCALVKYVASNNATLVLHRLVDVLGGARYIRALPFERMWRDAQAGRFMPMSNQAARRIIGASSLGVALAPVIGFDETGQDSRAKA